MPGKFVVKKGTTGHFRFTLLSTNGQIVATSQAYETKRAALNRHRVGAATGSRRGDRGHDPAAAAPAKAAAKPTAKKKWPPAR